MRTFGFPLRALWLGFEVCLVAFRFIVLLIRTGGKPSLRERSECLQRGCRRTGRVFLKEIQVRGAIPESGLIVSNHLSYVDILMLGSLSPTVFVSKAEVKNWPVFGWFSRISSTVFVQRERRGEVGKIAEQIQSLLRDGHLVVLFPEGTSSSGETVLPFKSALLEPVVGCTEGLHTSSISYQLEGGDTSQDVCYWGDMTFFPHAMKLLTKSRAEARVTFAPVREPALDRKQLAKQLHAQVLILKDSSPMRDEMEAELAAKSF
jgi:lyso-ornithine lipid O-acyltransferase